MGWLRYLILGLVGVGAPGCLGVAQNPSYFPFYLPTGDVIRTHAKPPGLGYFRNFDRSADRVSVSPTTGTHPTRSQVVLIATVYDRDGDARRKRRVEWILDGPGSIVEVDESGFAPGRGYKVDNKYAVSYTDYLPHTITRGNDDPRDDFDVRPGQSWCVVSSPVEGQTTITVYAPEVHDWDRGRVFTKLTWSDGEFQAEPGGPSGQPTSRGTDRDDPVGQPVSRTQIARRGPELTLDVQAASTLGLNRDSPVTFRLANNGTTDSPPAMLRTVLPEGVELVSAVPPPNRRTGTALSWQLEAIPANRTRDVVLTVRPTKKGSITVSAMAETTDGLRAEQQATATVDTASLKLSVSAPPMATTGGRVSVKVSVANTGGVAIENAVAWVDPGSGLTADRSEVSIGRIPVGDTRTVTVPITAGRSGKIPVVVTATADGGLSERGEVAMSVGKAELEVTVSGPDVVPIGQDGLYEVRVMNRGDAALSDVTVAATVPRSLRAEVTRWDVGPLVAGEKKTLRLTVVGDRLTEKGQITATAAGRSATGDRIAAAPATSTLSVVGVPVLVLELVESTGLIPVGGRARYRVTVRNKGTGAAREVALSADLSEPLKATRGDGPNGTQATINMGKVQFPPINALAPGETVRFVFEAEGLRSGDGRVKASVVCQEVPSAVSEEQATSVAARSR